MSTIRILDDYDAHEILVFGVPTMGTKAIRISRMFYAHIKFDVIYRLFKDFPIKYFCKIDNILSMLDVKVKIDKSTNELTLVLNGKEKLI